MTDETFTDPEDPSDSWADVRMTNPDEGEWDVDFVVVDGQVNYVDLRVRPEFLAGFVECLVDDVDDDRASSILRELIERKDLDISSQPLDE